MALAFLLGTAPMAVQAQPAAEVAAVQKVIKEYYANPLSDVIESDITISGVKIEGAFAKANVVIKKRSDHPTVFLQKKRNRWDVTYDNTRFGEALCQKLGFPRNSTLCPP